MSVRSVEVSVDCDRCPTQIRIELRNLDENPVGQVDRGLVEFGWWQTADLNDVCPAHPRLAVSS